MHSKQILILQGYYDEEDRHSLWPQATPSKVKACTRYFEAAVLLELIEHKRYIGSDYFGYLGPAAREKIPNLPQLLELIPSYLGQYNFFCFHGANYEQVWRQGHKYHGGMFLECATRLFEKLGVDVDLLQLKCRRAYFNYHILETDKYVQYVRECLAPSIAIMEDRSDVKFQALLNSDACYTRELGALSQEQVRSITGFDHYTLHPFILERLFPTFAALQGWTGLELDSNPRS